MSRGQFSHRLRARCDARRTSCPRRGTSPPRRTSAHRTEGTVVRQTLHLQTEAMGEDGAARPSIVGAFCLLAVVLCGAIALPLTNFTSPGRDVTLVVEDSSPAAQQKPFRASKRLRQLDKARHRGKGRGIPAVGINGSAPFHPEAKARQSRRRHGRGSRNNLWHRRRVPPPPPPPLPAPEVSGGAGSAAPAVSAPLPSATEDRAAIAKRLEVARFCDSMDIDLPPQCRRPLPCDLRAFDPGPRFNRFVTQGR